MAQLMNWEFPVRLRIRSAIVLLLLLAAASCSAEAPCGVRQLSGTGLIIGGIEVKPGDWPWHVALFRPTNGRKPEYFCGGSITSRELVITAAHCFDKENPSNVIVKVGLHDLSDTSATSKVDSYAIRELLIHPSYNKTSYYHDIALIRLATPIQYDPSAVAPICLWPAGSQSSAKMGIVAGFGGNGELDVSMVLQQAQIELIDKSTCKTRLPKHAIYLMNDNSKFCGIGVKNRTGVCYGDSGGGLYYSLERNGSPTWHLRGIVSASPRLDTHGGIAKCHTSSAQIYTDVSRYTDWINANQRIINERFLFEDDSCGAVRNDQAPNEASRPVFNQYPWNVLLEYVQLGYNPGMHLVCSGVLVHRRFVLTAGHCTEGTSKHFRLTSVRLGEFNLGTTDDADPASQGGQTFRAQSIDVQAIFRYPDEIRPIKTDGLALLMLKYDADLTRDNIKPICLLGETKFPISGLSLTGWKRKKLYFPALERDLMERTVLDECRNEFKQNRLRLPSSERFMCAVRTAPQPGKCHSYSTGSPLQFIRVVDGKPHYFLAGLSLFSPPACYPNSSIVFLNINDAAGWIKATVVHQMLNLQKAANSGR